MTTKMRGDQVIAGAVESGITRLITRSGDPIGQLAAATAAPVPKGNLTSTAIDFESIKNKQRAGWETGDYPRVGNTLQIIAELLVEAADIRAGQRALDVACGHGNAAARRFGARRPGVPRPGDSSGGSAARRFGGSAVRRPRRFADATGVDYAANLLARGCERAEVEFQESAERAVRCSDHRQQAWTLSIVARALCSEPSTARPASRRHDPWTDPCWAGTATRGLGSLNAGRRDHAAATHWLAQAAARCCSVPDRYEWVHAHVLDGGISEALHHDSHDAARALLANLAALAARCDLREPVVRAELRRDLLCDPERTCFRQTPQRKHQRSDS